MKKLLADIQLAPPGGFDGPATGLFEDPGTNSVSKFQDLFSKIVGVMTIIAGIWFMFVLLTGAIGWLAAGADKGAVEASRKKISTGLTGLVIVVVSLFILEIVGLILGVDFLDLAAFLNDAYVY